MTKKLKQVHRRVQKLTFRLIIGSYRLNESKPSGERIERMIDTPPQEHRLDMRRNKNAVFPAIVAQQEGLNLETEKMLYWRDGDEVGQFTHQARLCLEQFNPLVLIEIDDERTRHASHFLQRLGFAQAISRSQLTIGGYTLTSRTSLPHSLRMSSMSEVRMIAGFSARRAVATTTASMAYL